MRNLLIVASVVFGLSGCGSKDKFDEVLGEMESYKNKMCECKDKACADKVQDEWREYRKSMKEKLGKDSKPSDAQDKKGRALDEEMRTCRRKLGDAGGPPPPPPHADTAPTPTETAPAAPAAPAP